ncbi:MAG TPA: hypothetical protein PL124_07120 [Candidatus Cloacimonadota bacterium]|nr:hypothetical protein [Candidatus Cloacimonadota bacterium]
MLEEILGQKLRVKEQEAEIKKIEEANGLPELRKQLKAAQMTLDAMLAEAVLKKVFEEGTLRIVSSGKNMRYINVSKFREEQGKLFEQFATVPVTAVENAIVSAYEEAGNPKKDAKAMAQELLEPYIEIRPTEKWDVLDLVGDVSGNS